MEQDFQTSFIPKKPMIEERAVASRPIGLLTIISIFIFISVILTIGGLYFYKGVLAKSLTDMQTTLNLAQGRLEKTEIDKLQLLDKRLHASTQVLGNHIAVSPIFDALEKTTLKTIRYTKFSYSQGADAKAAVRVTMSGQASWTQGYTAIALQSDIFSKNAKFLIDPVFSNLSLEDKTGNVLFDLTFSVDPTFINYKEVLKTQSTAPQN